MNSRYHLVAGPARWQAPTGQAFFPPVASIYEQSMSVDGILLDAGLNARLECPGHQQRPLPSPTIPGMESQPVPPGPAPGPLRLACIDMAGTVITDGGIV